VVDCCIIVVVDSGGIVVVVGISSKVAVTVRFSFIVTIQLPVPVHPPPLQPAKVESASAAAVKVIEVPLSKAAVQSAPQAILPSALVIEPVPGPVLVAVKTYFVPPELMVVVGSTEVVVGATVVVVVGSILVVVGATVVVVSATVVVVSATVVVVSATVVVAGATVVVVIGINSKVAVTVMLAFIVTVQVSVPLHPPPLQPVKVAPVAAAAVKVTEVPLSKDSVQSAPQSMPAPDTVPLPVPDLATVRSYLFRVKAAVTDFAASIVTEQEPVPVQAPLQPVKVEPVDGAAVKVTAVL